MPTLIMEKRVDKADGVDASFHPPATVEVLQEVASEDISSKTPKRANCVNSPFPKQRKVTPGTTSITKKKKKDKEDDANEVAHVAHPAKKQKSLLSFFSKAATKPGTQSGARTSTTSLVTSIKKAKSGIHMESLRDIVMGSVASPLPGCDPIDKGTPENYNRHKGSPMPTNLKQPTFGSLPSLSSPRGRFLDRLNQQDTSQVLPLPTENDNNVMASQYDRMSAIAVHDDDDGENTVCFSQESQQHVDMDVEQPSSSDDVPNASKVHEVVEETKNQAIVQEVIVDMTQMDTTQSNHEDVPVEEEDDDDVTFHIKECIVDLTQIDSGDDQRTYADKGVNKVTLLRELPSDFREDTKIESIGHSSGAATPPKATRKRKVVPSKSEPEARTVEKTKSPERLAMLEKNEALRQKTLKGSAQLIERVSKGLEEEVFTMPSPRSIHADAFDNELTQQAVVKLAVIVQGSDLPLSVIANNALELLMLDFGTITAEAVSEKIKTYFTREHYISCNANEMKTINKFEDTADRMWRWEIVSPELLPNEIASMVKKSQAARKRIRSHSRAQVNLLRALDDADKVLVDASSPRDQCDKIMTKVKSSEENLLKFERAAEKARLLEDAKAAKERERIHKNLEREKERVLKEKEAAARKEEEAKTKLENQKRREDEKQKKKEQLLEKKRKEEESKVAALEKNKSRMLHFFVAKTGKDEPSKAQVTPKVEKSSDDAVRFWALINSAETHSPPLFKRLSSGAIASRKRRTKMVTVSVYITTVPDDPFSCQQPYAEQRTVQFPNKYKFLSFHEDHRPAYHGTWSKRSRIIKGKTPFAQDMTILNYDEDSEAEWEEGDDEFGEDLQDEDADGEEENIDPIEGDTRNYNFEDGWMAADDEVVYENEEFDDDTKLLRKKIKAGDTQLSEEIVAPLLGGPVVDLIKSETKVDIKNYVFVNDEKQSDPSAVLQLDLMVAEAEILSDEDVFMDAFPPNLMDETFVGDPSTIGTSTTGVKPISQEMSIEDMKVFAEFVHHAAFASKDRLVEDLRMTHPSLTSSRAQATRKLDSVARKTKNPRGGVIWEVKRTVLEELGLEKQLAMTIPEPEVKKLIEPNTNLVQKSKPSSAKDPTQSHKAEEETIAKCTKDVEPRKRLYPAVPSKAESKKRKEPSVSAASAALFAKFIAGGSKKRKTC